MNTYKVFWLDGHTEIISGSTANDAFNRAGYSAGALRAVDYFQKMDTPDPNKTYYVYDDSWLCLMAVSRVDIEPYLHEHASETIIIEERDIETGITNYGWMLEPFMPTPAFFEIR